MNDAAPDPVSIHLLTGFLGSGKTTLLNRLLRSAWMEGTLVIVNEFGEVGLDHLLIERPEDETILLANGCLCCAVKGDFIITLSRLILRRDAGELPPFTRVVIETTGIADPAPILRTLYADKLVSSRYALHGVTTVVDACNGLSTIERNGEAFKQVALATQILVSKTDVADAATVERTIGKLRQINADARIETTALPDREIVRLLDTGQSDLAASLLAGRGLEAADVSHDAAGTRVSSFVLRHEGEVTTDAFRLWLNALGRFRGPDLLRLKGLVNLEGKPVVIQAVQDIVHDPVTLDAWPQGEPRTEIVFITRNIGREAIEPTLAALSYGTMDKPESAAPFGLGDYTRFVEAVRGFAPMERT
jgi:G3E family GTPase